MDDLLKDAIADAKAVRETALANAKIALEEAFTPRIQSMLSQKIQSETEGEEEAPVEEPEAEEEPEVAVEPEVGEEPADFEEDDEDPSDEFSEEPVGDEEEFEVEEDGEFSEEEPVEDEEDVIEINGVKYAPIVSEDEEEFEAEPEVGEEESDELDLEAILRELEDGEEELEEDYDEAGTGDGLDSSEVETADEAELAENDVSSDIGAGDNKVDDDSNDSSDIGAQGPEGEGSDSAAGAEDDNLEIVDDLVEVNGVKYAPISEDEEDEEDIDLEEILKALSEGDDEEAEEESAVEELVAVKSELKEHRNVVKYLRGKLNEVNLLNAKLLFTNKLFRSYGLNNEQKLKVVETFDRAKNLREVKLVFSTLAESFGNKPSKTETIKESKGSASKAVASTKPKSKKVIEEGFDMKDRFQKLANIL